MMFLLVTFDFPPSIGGIQTRVKSYVQNLVKMGHEVILVHMVEPEDWRSHFGNYGGDAIVESFQGATVFRLRYTIAKTIEIFIAVLRCLRGRKPDVVHVFSGINLAIGNLFLLYGIARRCKVGMSLFGKDYLASRPNPVYFVPLIFSLSLAQMIGVNSRATLELVPSSLRRKGRVLYAGVNIDELGKAVKIRRDVDEEQILYVGRLVKRKGPDLLVRAFNMLLENHPKAKLFIVGDGPFAGRLRELVEELGMKDKVEFTGSLKGEPLYSRYAECDVFAMPSWQTSTDVEGFGMVFLEAGFFKKPCIGTKTGGIPEAVLDGETGLLVPQGDVMKLRDAMNRLLNDKELARRLGERAHHRVVSEFTWEKATLRFLTMYSTKYDSNRESRNTGS